MPRIWLLLVVVSLAFSSQAQEILRSNKNNTALANPVQSQNQWALNRSGTGIRDTLCLPFFDDFSNPRRWLGAQGGPCNDTVYPTNPAVYPNNLLWCDRGAYINATYPDNPPSYGVATLDGLNSNGKPYNESAPYGPADTLTSKPIFLGGTLSDSIFLSFFYQPGGRGDSPETQDSLLLQFRRSDSSWVTVWQTINSDGAIPDPFRLAMVNATSPDYQYDGFQFRFRNYANRSGNNDHWHIDYILLDEDRDRGDTLFRDVSFSEPPPSMLKRYHSMPWKQFKNAQTGALRNTMEARVYNLFNTANNTNFQDSLIETSSGSLIGLTASESAAIPAQGYYTYFHDNQEVPGSTPGFEEDSLSLTWRLRLRPSGDIDAFNDTLLVQQNFYNYFAYDDGSAEKAYGLIGTGARLAYRFEATEPDSIYAVYIHWAFVTGGLGDKFFSLLVFQDIDTTGATDNDSILYQEDFLVPKYPDSVNGWWIYNLEQPVPVNGIFYIGWLQSQEDILNVGFDQNTVSNNQLYYDLGDSWIQSSLFGSVMMRPQTGPNYRVYPTLGVQEPAPYRNDIRIWPNPASEMLYFQIGTEPGSRSYRYQIHDLTGRLCSHGIASGGEISTSALNPGMYFLQITHPNGPTWVSRFVRTP